MEDAETTAEKNLWIAVIETVFTDATTYIKRMQRQLKKFGHTENATERDLEKMYHLIKSDWFSMICDHVNIHHTHIRDGIKRIEVEHGIHKRPKKPIF